MVFKTAVYSGSGHYIHHEATSYSSSKLNITLNLMESKDYCLKFAYHMHGNYMGSLDISLGNVKVWKRSGNKGDQWHREEVPFRFISKGSIVSVFMLYFMFF